MKSNFWNSNNRKKKKKKKRKKKKKKFFFMSDEKNCVSTTPTKNHHHQKRVVFVLQKNYEYLCGGKAFVAALETHPAFVFSVPESILSSPAAICDAPPTILALSLSGICKLASTSCFVASRPRRRSMSSLRMPFSRTSRVSMLDSYRSQL